MKTDQFDSFDGVRLAIHRFGVGRPVILLHGLFSSAQMNWIRFGHAEKLAAAGFEVLMPDLRTHGDSDKPHDPAAYPDDVLVRDVEAIVAGLKLSEFDLVGFSLGARTAFACVAAGMKPNKLVLAGMGLESLSNWGERIEFFIDTIDRIDEIKRDDPAFMHASFIKSQKTDLVASRLLLSSLHWSHGSAMDAVTMPTMVLCGSEDRDNGSPEELAEALPDARYVEIPGTHMGSVTQGELGDALVEFLSEKP
ncbi:MAG: alpha/beta hydrolase [Citromicrobium sp.]|nr:MAG: alpha/beta hydrolase [Citromicrobium sp.]